MSLKTKDEYLGSLRQMNKVGYLFGERLSSPTEHPLLRPSVDAIAMTYELAQRPEHAGLMTATSNLSGRRINRFTHLHQSTGDLVAKVKMLRLLGQKTGCCFQRCVGMDALNALDSVTFEMDLALHTDYHVRFRRFVEHVQDDDLVVDGAMTDAKGNRRLRPSQQDDPDLFLRIVERRAEGVVIRGAKLHQTGALNAHEILVLPTMALTDDEGDYAIACALPSDAPGVVMVCGRQPSDTRRLEASLIDVGNCSFGGHEAVVIFDDVFVPWERVFLCGETAYAGLLVERFAGYHRQSYGGCKSGVGDVLIGAAVALARCLGIDEAPHVRDKIVEMVHLNETLYACGIACSAEGRATASGTYLIDLMLANVCKLNVTRFPYEIARLAQDIAGGLLVTLPSQADMEIPEVGPRLRKYLRGADSASTEYRQRLLRLLENLSLGPGAAAYLTESLHGAGSPQAQRIMLGRLADLGEKVRLAEALAGLGSQLVEE